MNGSVFAKAFSTADIIDCHVHLHKVDDLSKMIRIMERNGIDKVNAACLPNINEENALHNHLGLLFKILNPGKAYAFGALRYPRDMKLENGRVFEEQVKKMKKLGFDGVKLHEGKPSERKRTGIPLNSPVYRDFFRFMESEKMPILFHVADPGTFYDKDSVPDWAVNNGWAYLDDSYLSKDALYAEVEEVLKMFPGLRIIFAHFYFMAEEGCERASDFLDHWPDVSFDLTPGGEQYTFFSMKSSQWRDFFVKYQDRILFGTDNDYGISDKQIHTIRTFLETDGSLPLWGDDCHGISLDRVILEKIYSGNFIRCAGSTPAAVNLDMIPDECRTILDIVESSGKKDELLPEAKRIIEMFRRL